METLTVVTKLVNAIEKRDADAVGALLAENISFENIPSGQIVLGKANTVKEFSGFFEQASDIRWEIERQVVNGNIAMIERINHIKLGDKEIKLPMVTVMEVDNGKVSLFRDYFDVNTFVTQTN